MIITCNRKGCMQTTEAKLNLETNNVVCDSCGGDIENITEFTKKALKTMNQVIRVKHKQSFQVFCKDCNKNVTMRVEEGKAYCSECKSALKISAAFMRSFTDQKQEKE
jgi:hypothetical protein